MVRPAVILAWLLAATAAKAHEGPHVELAALDAALERRPDDVDLLLRRATLHRREGHVQASLADLIRVEQLSPGLRELLLERGLTRAAAGRAAEAEADLGRFLEGGPSEVALVARARLREARGRADLARADYDAAIRIRPDPETFLARGRIDEAQGHLDRAAAGYEEGLRALGGAVSLRLALIRAETALGHHERVIALADQAMAGSSLKADWLLVRADARAASGHAEAAASDRAAALREVDDTLKRRPSSLAHVTRARVLLALDRPAEAVSELEGAVARSPRLTDAEALLVVARRRAAEAPLPSRHEGRSAILALPLALLVVAAVLLARWRARTKRIP